MKETVNHPAHYNAGSIEVIEAIEAWGCGFCDGNVVKYVARFRHKNGIEDLKKAQWYLTRLIQQEENNVGIRSEGDQGQCKPSGEAANDDHSNVPAIHSRRSDDASGSREERGQQSGHSVAEDDVRYRKYPSGPHPFRK